MVKSKTFGKCLKRCVGRGKTRGVNLCFDGSGNFKSVTKARDMHCGRRRK